MDFKSKLSRVKTIQEAADLRETLDPLSEEWQEAENKLRELLKAKYKDEKVLVVHKDFVPDFKEKRYVGFEEVGKEAFGKLEKNVTFMPRHQAEYNPTYKQIIPYCFITKGEDIFATVRKEGDPRLVGAISLGIGGHINPVDVDNETGLFTLGLKREMEEEVIIKDCTNTPDLVGYIYDPTNIVGQDHFGLVYKLILESNSSIEINEKDTLEGTFMTKDELKRRNNHYRAENWSKLIIDNLL